MHSRIALRGLTHFAPALIAMWRQATAANTLTKLDTELEAAHRNAIAAGAAAGGG